MYKFAIIGCGRISERHAENINKNGKLVAVCDTDINKADSLAEKYKAKAYYSIEDLLINEKEIDIVSVCTPNGFHAEHSIKSLQAGKHVLCEKPLCITSAAAWQLMETEKFTRRKLYVVKSTRYNPLLIQLKNLIEEKKLGQLYSFHLSCLWNRPDEYYNDWHGKNFPDGGTLYTQFSHYIDALLWLLGDVEEVKGFATNAAHKNKIEFEDTGAASVKMKNNMLGSINWSVNTYKKNCEISFTIIAENGTIIIGGEYLNEVKYKQIGFDFEFDTNFYTSNNYSSYQGSMSNHQQVYENMIKALEDPQHKFTTAYDGLKTVETIEKIYKAVSQTTS